VLQSAGIEQLDVIAEPGVHAIPTPESWWSAVLGSGYRGTVDQLDPDTRERVRETNIDYIRQLGVGSVEANVVSAVATKDFISAA